MLWNDWSRMMAPFEKILVKRPDCSKVLAYRVSSFKQPIAAWSNHLGTVLVRGDEAHRQQSFDDWRLWILEVYSIEVPSQDSAQWKVIEERRVLARVGDLENEYH